MPYNTVRTLGHTGDRTRAARFKVWIPTTGTYDQKKKIPHAGLEPAISGLEDLRVIQLR